jgi:hypothetical protein
MNPSKKGKIKKSRISIDPGSSVAMPKYCRRNIGK